MWRSTEKLVRMFKNVFFIWNCIDFSCGFNIQAVNCGFNEADFNQVLLKVLNIHA